MRQRPPTSARAGDLHTQRDRRDRGLCAGSRQVTTSVTTSQHSETGPPRTCMRWAELKVAPQPVLCNLGRQRDTELRLQTARLTPSRWAGLHSHPPAVRQGLLSTPCWPLLRVRQPNGAGDDHPPCGLCPEEREVWAGELCRPTCEAHGSLGTAPPVTRFVSGREKGSKVALKVDPKSTLSDAAGFSSSAFY